VYQSNRWTNTNAWVELSQQRLNDAVTRAKSKNACEKKEKKNRLNKAERPPIVINNSASHLARICLNTCASYILPITEVAIGLESCCIAAICINLNLF
jgi:hypothetical protein